jgi:hypothetical protein
MTVRSASSWFVILMISLLPSGRWARTAQASLMVPSGLTVLMLFLYRVLNYAGYKSAHEQGFVVMKKPVSTGVWDKPK